MNTHDSLSAPVPAGKLNRASRLLRAAWNSIETQELRRVTQDEISRYLDIAPGTLINWTNRDAQLSQLESVLRLLERLPGPSRYELMDRFLRKYPTIESPELAQEPTQVSRLRLLLREGTGLSLIQGSESARTFLFTALGHSVCQMEGSGDAVSGFDAHYHDWFVPVEGVTYLTRWATSTSLRAEVDKVWPKAAPRRWLMFNGVWHLLPRERRQELFAWAVNHHVVLADASVCQPPQLAKLIRGLNIPVRLLQVSEPGRGVIQVDFHLP
jgi:hypothetical protein